MKKINPSAGYSIVLKFSANEKEGEVVAKVVNAVYAVGGGVSSLREIDKQGQTVVREIIINLSNDKIVDELVSKISAIEGVMEVSQFDQTFFLHEGGKLSVESHGTISNADQLSMLYTPGVARVCKAIEKEPDLAYKYTIKKNTVAIVTDGTAVLGLGDIGPLAGLPVMEGKAVLFKEFGGVDAFPICLDTTDPDEIVDIVTKIAPVFGGINLEDIKAPNCFQIEKRLDEILPIPVFHDDQHGTAIVVLAALINSVKLLDKNMDDLKVVINGAGAAGITIGKLLRRADVQDIVMCDSKGLISKNRDNVTPEKLEFATDESGTLSDAVVGRDLFIGVSVPGVLTRAMVKTMADQPLIFAMANPVPEIQPEEVSDIVAVVATGRSDYPNQINNVLAFPGIFRGALDARASKITVEMQLEAAKAIAGLISKDKLHRDYIIPSVFDDRVANAVADAVKSVV